MQRGGLYALLALTGFALVFAALPTPGGVTAKAGARLSGVQLELYQASDPDSVWRFGASEVLHDPLSSVTALSGISGGERLVRERVGGVLTGREVLDARLQADDLSIDGNDDLSTRQATITLIAECADVKLTGTEKQPVNISGDGFSAPLATVRAPSLSVRVPDLKMDFQFQILEAGRMELEGDLDAPESCQGGVRVPKAPS